MRVLRHRERVEQAHIVTLLRMIGSGVYVLGTTRPRTDSYFGTRQTPGLVDLIAFLPARAPDQARRILMIEVKAAGGRLRPEQAEFRDYCRAAEVAHLVGGLDAVIAYLVEHRYIRADQVPAYRLTWAKG